MMRNRLAQSGNVDIDPGCQSPGLPMDIPGGEGHALLELLSSPQRDDRRKNIPNIPLNAATTALLVVDVQPEYWSNCPAVRKDFPHFPDNLKRTVDTCRKEHTKVIWVRADYRYSHSPWLVQFARIHEGRRPEKMIEILCDNPTSEDAWEDFATPQTGEVVIPKTSWSSASNTGLIDMLRLEGVDTVLVCGLITSVCVQHSAFGVFEAGFRTLLVEDACADRGRARHDAALTLYGDYMYELVTSEELDGRYYGRKRTLFSSR